MRPSAFSEAYAIGLNYRIDRRPRVEVLEKDFVVPECRSHIHMFRDRSLSLYFKDEFTKEMVVEKNILLWTTEGSTDHSSVKLNCEMNIVVKQNAETNTMIGNSIKENSDTNLTQQCTAQVN